MIDWISSAAATHRAGCETALHRFRASAAAIRCPASQVVKLLLLVNADLVELVQQVFGEAGRGLQLGQAPGRAVIGRHGLSCHRLVDGVLAIGPNSAATT